MELKEKIILQGIEDAKDRALYLRDIDIGIPSSEIDHLEKHIIDAENALYSNKSTIAQNKLLSFNNLFLSLEKKYFSSLTPRQIDNISRSEQRPKTLDYAREVFEEFEELKGLESNSVDPAVICGFAKLDRNDVIVIGHEKGGFREDFRRGGSALPHGNQKAVAAMKLAEKFDIPVVTFIDTPGSWPLEEFLPAQRIAKNLEMQYLLKVPHVSVVIGEGGSGGALAIDICDYRVMLDKAYYSVISISGGAAIIARDKRHITQQDMDRAAENLKITAADAFRLGMVDRIIVEPKIGARKTDKDFFPTVRAAIIEGLNTVKASVYPFFTPDTSQENIWRIRKMMIPVLLRKRYRKYRNLGVYHTSISDKIKHIMGELYRVRWIHSLSAPFRKSVDIFRKRKIKEKQKESLLQAEEQPKVLSYEDRWVECPNTEIHGCQDIWVPTLFEEYNGTCPNCGYHFRQIIDNYIQLIADPGSFREFNEGIESVNPLGFEGFGDKLVKAKKSSGRKCAMITGYALVNGHPVVVILTDVRFRAGTLGSAEGEKFCRAVKRAMREKKPLVAVHQSGGARIEEGILALVQMAKTSIAIARYKQAGGYYISVNTDPTMAGVLASYASLGDFILAEPNAQIGFAGIHVIEQTVKQKKPRNYQHSEMVMGRGGVDMVIRRNDLKLTISKLLDFKKMKGREY
ncbi:MAG: carboxyl transferase domain-containing protein [Spirochaetota bacterium]